MGACCFPWASPWTPSINLPMITYLSKIRFLYFTTQKKNTNEFQIAFSSRSFFWSLQLFFERRFKTDPAHSTLHRRLILSRKFHLVLLANETHPIKFPPWTFRHLLVMDDLWDIFKPFLRFLVTLC